MRVANKYSVQVTNRFQLVDSSDSGSEDEAIANVDPYAIIKQAEADAIKLAKQKIKEGNKKVVPVLEPKKEEPQEVKRQDNRRNNRREPRGNNQARRGPRTERPERNNDNTLSENNNQASRDDGNRRPRRNRDQDRKSGNPVRGVKATEKKGGAGAGNWGKADENLEETVAPVEEKVTDENAENADPEEQAEPEEVTLSLEEYYKTLGSVETTTNTNARKANNGEAVKGNVVRKNKIFIDRKNTHHIATKESNQSKVVLPNEQLSFISGRNDRRNDRNNNDRRGGRGRRNDNFQADKKKQPKEFNMEKASQDFPKLGGK